MEREHTELLREIRRELGEDRCKYPSGVARLEACLVGGTRSLPMYAFHVAKLLKDHGQTKKIPIVFGDERLSHAVEGQALWCIRVIVEQCVRYEIANFALGAATTGEVQNEVRAILARTIKTPKANRPASIGLANPSTGVPMPQPHTHGPPATPTAQPPPPVAPTGVGPLSGRIRRRKNP